MNILRSFVISKVSTQATSRKRRLNQSACYKHPTWSLVSYPVFLLSMLESSIKDQEFHTIQIKKTSKAETLILFCLDFADLNVF